MACDNGDTMPYVVKACTTLIDWGGSSVGSWGNRSSLKSRRNQTCLTSEVPLKLYESSPAYS